MPRLVLAYDGSPAAATAVRAAAAIFPGAEALIVTVPAPAEVGAGTVRLAVPTLPPAVVQRTVDELAAETREEARATAQDGVEQARSSGLDAEIAPAPAREPVWATVLQLARELSADVVVCGSRGRGGFSRALLGSTSTSLLHHADRPLLVAPAGAEQHDGPVVLAYDGSDPAKRAIEVAGRLLPGRGAVVVHAWESEFRRTLTARALRRGPVDDLRDIVDLLEQTVTEAAEARTQEGVAAARAAGLDPVGESVESAEGVWRAVAAAARANAASVVVAGARGLGGARSALLGSVSSGLVHNAGQPVLIVPARTPAS